MKIILAILLVVTLVVALIPAGMQADAAAVTKKPFYTLNMEPIFWEEGDLVMDMVYFGSHLNADKTEAIITWNRQTDIAAIAKDLKEEFDARPEGTRYIYMHLPCHVINVKSGLIEDYIFFDKPTAIIKKWTEEFMAEYKRIGGKLDGASVDIEYIHGDAYYICTEQYEKGNKDCYWEIVNNPKYRTDMRPKLERMGFDFWPESKQDSEKSEIWSMSPRVGGFAKNYYIWNNAVGELLTESINESVLEPMLKHYPDALLSDYGRYDYYGWQKQYLGSIATLLGNAVKVGNVSSRQCYPTDPWENAVGLYKTPDGYNNANYIASPFNMVLWRTNDVKGILEADTNNRISTWITFYNFMPTLPGSYCNTPYYSEQIYHLGMLDPQPFLGYVIESEVGQYGLDHPDPDASDPEVVRGVIGELMAELTRVAGYSDRKPIRIPANWNNDYILSGMYANGRNIWRITPDTTNGMTLDAFKVEGDDPTFSINGQTVTFPQGRILEDTKISKVGTCGFWVETPANVMPVMTSDADRYEKDPSFAENFEGFENGVAFNNNVTDAWKTSGKTANVLNHGGSKALAFTGNTRLTNVNAPKNITAGDKYAQQQVWQVTVTVPKGGELQLLSASSQDLGVKIVDGKVYYTNGGSYIELAGVSVSAGSTYTVKRKVDFRNFTSDYAIYDTAGKCLGSVKNTKMAAVSLPVTEITIAAKNVTGTAYIDNYKLYPTGLTTDFMVYNADTGMEVDATQSRNGNTAYRLSWLNATGEDMMAKVYNGSTLVGEFRMGSGQDGVNTGVVKANGKSVLLTVKTEVAPPLPTPPSGNGGGNNDGGQTTVPTTPADGTEPNNPVEDTNPTEGTAPTDPADATNPAEGNDSSNNPSNQPSDGNSDTPSQKKDGLSDVAIALIVLAGLLVLTGGAFALLWFVVKPQWLMNFFQKPAPQIEEPPVE